MKKTIGKKRVSFDCDPEIRYRTTSDSSSTSTLKNIQSRKRDVDIGLYLSPPTGKIQNFNETLMASNKNSKLESEAEKKFDDLLKDKCSWTYKSIKTIKCQTSKKHNRTDPIVKIKTMNIEETAYNRDSCQNGAKCLLDEYDIIDADIKKNTKKLRNSKSVQYNSVKNNQNGYQSKNKQMSTIRKKYKRTLKVVNYTESNSGSEQSSSDDGLVFLSRAYDDRMLDDTQCTSNFDIKKFPQKSSLNICADESNYNINNKFEISETNFLKNSEISNNQNFITNICDEVNEVENNSVQEERKPCFQDQAAMFDLLFDDEYQKNNLNQNSFVNSPEKETGSLLYEAKSSLNEGDCNKLEEKNKLTKNENIRSKKDLDSEIIQVHMTVSQEIQSVCNQFETPDNDDNNELFSDFFSGNFNLDKYKSKISTSTSITTERNENSIYKSVDSDNRIHSKGKIRNNKNLDEATETKEKFRKSKNKINFKNKSNMRNSINLKEQHALYLDSDRTSFGRSNAVGTENDVLVENEYSVKNDYFKENSFNVHEKGQMINKNEHKRDDFKESKNGAKQYVKNTKAHQFLDKRITNLPAQYDATQQLANSNKKIKENMWLDNIKNGSSVKCKKKVPKTWEDLEADLLNRNEQISFLLQLETDEGTNLYQTGFNQNELSFNGSVDNSEAVNTKTRNKWSIIKSEQGNIDHLTNDENDLTFESPNASIINRVIKNMQLCTSPVLTPSKVVSQREDNLKSPILTEYSYSVQETKSVFTIEKKLDKKQIKQSKTPWEGHIGKNMMQKNSCKENDIKTVISSHEVRSTNQIPVKQNEILGRENIKLSKSLEFDCDNLTENSSEMENIASESYKYPLLPQDSYSNVSRSCNLRKRKLKDNADRSNIAKVNNVTENSIIKYQRNKQVKKNIKNKSIGEGTSNENFALINKEKSKRKFMNSFTDQVDETELEDLSENGTLITTISDRQKRCEEKINDNLKTPKTNNKRMSSQTNTDLASGMKKSQDQKQVYRPKKMVEANRPKQKQTKDDSKREYEKYLQKLFSKDIEDSNIQWEFLDGTSEKNIEKKGNISYSNAQKLLAENSNEELLSLSSDTDFEDAEQPPSRRASGLLDEIFD